MKDRVVLRRLGGRVGVGVLAVAVIILLGWEAASYPWQKWWREPALPVLLVTACWLLWASSRAELTRERLRIVNAWLIHDVAWQDVRGCSRRFGLRIHMPHKDIAVSACPTPSALWIGLGPRPTRIGEAAPSYRDYEADPLRLSADPAQGARVIEDYRDDVLAAGPRDNSATTGVVTRPNVRTIGVVAVVACYVALTVLI
ncbi:hypothetical protein H8R18_05865 [Nanchangia anserum]|uniref:PH domain-containing protein n=1 Tax=Nanchangia anserum TaxID=2692125 RepID=A0A8I0KTX1_9ACTO|nr:hypothetical protein [Nanchangia anserum]MBD3689063.1 hypothetical protein [Nanchangia anserum]QOX81304.1 hypothetical protein H8R18_05865 [Nanchangia anserum]